MTSSTSRAGTKKAKKRRSIYIGLTVLFVIIILRLILPYIVLHYVNKSLAEISGYYGHVEDIDISLYRGAYVVNNLYINRVDTATLKQTELFKAPDIDISIEWKSLFHGRIVSELEFREPVLKFTEDAAEPEQMEKDTNDFRKMLKTFHPLQCQSF
jgi:hypothetical protein